MQETSISRRALAQDSTGSEITAVLMPRVTVRTRHAVRFRRLGEMTFQDVFSFNVRCAAWPRWSLEALRLAALQRLIRQRLYRPRSDLVYRARGHRLYRVGRDRELRDMLISLVNSRSPDIVGSISVIVDGEATYPVCESLHLNDVMRILNLGDCTLQFSYHVDNWMWP